MKHIKKVITLALAFAMVLAMSATAFAVDDGSITIENSVKDKTYNVYKVFDATYSGSGDTLKVSYTYDGTNDTFLAALQGNDSPFECTAAGDVYNISLKEGKTDEVVITWLKGQAANFGNAVKTVNGTGSALTVSGLAYGYYYITTTTGSAVTIDSALKDVTVIDKNQETTLDKQEQIATLGYYIDENGHKVESPIPTAGVGETVNYKVVGTFTRYIGEDKVTKLTFTDQMSAGLTGNHDVVVKINGETVSATVTYDPAATGTAGTKTTIVIPTVNANKEFLYPSESTYEITYSAVVNDAAVTRDEENNTVDLNYTDENGNDKDVDNDETKVKDYKITLTKQDKSTKEKLAGATFEIYDAATGGNKIPVVLITGDGKGDGTATATVNNVYRPAMAGETGVDIVTSKTGIVEILGLANGSYYFEEKAAPEGYNPLNGRTEATTITNADATITVDNQTGSELPSTGGIGTVIFYVLGSALIIGCGIVLISRRRVHNK